MALVAPRHVGSSRTRAWTCVPCIGRRILNHCATKEVQTWIFLYILPYTHGPCLGISLSVFIGVEIVGLRVYASSALLNGSRLLIKLVDPNYTNSWCRLVDVTLASNRNLTKIPKKWYLIVVLICTSLFTGRVEHLFICWLFVFSLSFVSRYFFISCLISSGISWLFSNVLFSLHVFAFFMLFSPVIYF